MGTVPGITDESMGPAEETDLEAGEASVVSVVSEWPGTERLEDTSEGTEVSELAGATVGTEEASVGILPSIPIGGPEITGGRLLAGAREAGMGSEGTGVASGVDSDPKDIPPSTAATLGFGRASPVGSVGGSKNEGSPSELSEAAVLEKGAVIGASVLRIVLINLG